MSTRFELGDFSIDEYRPMKVIVVGAGFSGIAAGIRFKQRVPNLEMRIYEKNEGIGGTWFSNRYPGVACDMPAHCYQYTFFQKTDWSAYYAPGREILGYLQNVVDTYKLAPYLHLGHEMTAARYDESTGKWHVRVRRAFSSGENGAEVHHEEFEDTADLLFTAVGMLSRWKWPDIDGLGRFNGTIMHSANWDLGRTGESAVSDETSQLKPDWKDDVRDWGTKRAAVIGAGSSAIQIIPALQPHVGTLYNYVRSKMLIALPPLCDKMAQLLARDPKTDSYRFTEEEKQAFQSPECYKEFRHELESEINSAYLSTLRGSETHADKNALFKANMMERLARKPWIADHLIPESGVAIRRLTPGRGYLDALCEDNVVFVPKEIKRITETGIETVDGEHEELDVIICATGFDTTYMYPFPVIGRNVLDLRARWSPHPETYLAVAVDGFPNFFFALGPNSGVGSGNLIPWLEQQVEYAVQVALKMQRERLKAVEVKREAVRDFDRYLEQYFPRTIFSEKFPSWYKTGKEDGRVTALWPGSCLHALRTLKHPRWEDYDYEMLDDAASNRMVWLGDGMTVNEKTMTGDRAWYLRDDYVNYPPRV